MIEKVVIWQGWGPLCDHPLLSRGLSNKGQSSRENGGRIVFEKSSKNSKQTVTKDDVL